MLEVRTEFPAGRLKGEVRARYQGADRYRFFGLGNETVRADPDDLDFSGVDRQILTLESEVRWGNDDDVSMTASTLLQLDLHSQSANAGRPIAQENRYGFQDLFQFGLRTTVQRDGRDHDRFPTRGTRLEFEGTYFPDITEIRSQYGWLAGSAEVFLQLPVPMAPVLALELGGKKVWGDYPYLNAAYLGGAETLRGTPDDRYAGDATVFAKSELRVQLGTRRKFFPGQFGVHGITDVGRVYLDGEDSDRWH